MPNTCMFPSCSQTLNGRGLCATHYNAALKLVKTGRTTWEELEAKGKVAPLRRPSAVVDFFLGEDPSA